MWRSADVCATIVNKEAGDYFSKNGITFSDCVCQIPVTTPSHSTILTGLNPYLHGSRINGAPISNDVLTLSQILSNMVTIGTKALMKNEK
jgi:hypothetical protein